MAESIPHTESITGNRLTVAINFLKYHLRPANDQLTNIESGEGMCFGGDFDLIRDRGGL